MNKNKIALGSDHAGFLLKEFIKEYFDLNGIEYEDFGTDSEISVDYPIYSFKVAQAVAKERCINGILCCGTGIGVCIAANKVKKIRAAVCIDETAAKLARQHNDINILCLGGRITDPQKAISICKSFLNTKFDGGRHQRRLDEITKIEKEDTI